MVKEHKDLDFMNTSLTRLIPVPLWNNFHQWPPIGGLRYLIFNAKFNGFEMVIKRAGRRILIDEQAFFKWVEKQNPKRESNEEAKLSGKRSY